MTILIPIPPRVDFVDDRRKITKPWSDYFDDVFTRVGGSSAPSITEIDAEIEAIDASVSALDVRVDLLEADVAVLDGRVDILEARPAGHIIEDEGVILLQRNTLNFAGAGVTVTDTGTKTLVTIAGGGGGGGSLDDIIALQVLL